jgi:hypothetical protein
VFKISLLLTFVDKLLIEMECGKFEKFFSFCGLFVVLVALIISIVVIVIALRPKASHLVEDEKGYVR